MSGASNEVSKSTPYLHMSQSTNHTYNPRRLNNPTTYDPYVITTHGLLRFNLMPCLCTTVMGMAVRSSAKAVILYASYCVSNKL